MSSLLFQSVLINRNFHHTSTADHSYHTPVHLSSPLAGFPCLLCQSILTPQELMLFPLLLIFSGYTVTDFTISLQTQMDSEALHRYNNGWWLCPVFIYTKFPSFFSKSLFSLSWVGQCSTSKWEQRTQMTRSTWDSSVYSQHRKPPVSWAAWKETWPEGQGSWFCSSTLLLSDPPGTLGTAQVLPA